MERTAQVSVRPCYNIPIAVLSASSKCHSLLEHCSKYINIYSILSKRATRQRIRSGAGAETTSTTLSWWMLSMIAFPKVQLRAQAEIDAAVGRDRLPTFADTPRLPYVRAIIREVLRWRPTAPFSIPHAATNEDWYEGMYIPKGTICVSNVWHCNHDQAVFGDDADDFRPERHLDEDGKLLPGPIETNQAGHVTFGSGRRICVGKDLANESLFIATVRMLWALNLERSRDLNGGIGPLDIETIVDGGTV